MRVLILLRHAKSDYPLGVPDPDRPLAARGARDAAVAAAWIGAAYPHIDEAVVSPARRAQETWAHVHSRVHAARVRGDERVYADWGSGLADVISGLDARSTSAIVVGHNPGIEELAGRLAGDGDAQARERMAHKYPTCGIAIIGFEDGWARLDRTRLMVFSVPRA